MCLTFQQSSCDAFPHLSFAARGRGELTGSLVRVVANIFVNLSSLACVSRDGVGFRGGGGGWEAPRGTTHSPRIFVHHPLSLFRFISLVPLSRLLFGIHCHGCSSGHFFPFFLILLLSSVCSHPELSFTHTHSHNNNNNNK